MLSRSRSTHGTPSDFRVPHDHVVCAGAGDCQGLVDAGHQPPDSSVNRDLPSAHLALFRWNSPRSSRVA